MSTTERDRAALAAYREGGVDRLRAWVREGASGTERVLRERAAGIWFALSRPKRGMP
jgi:hypothetical protein